MALTLSSAFSNSIKGVCLISALFQIFFHSFLYFCPSIFTGHHKLLSSLPFIPFFIPKIDSNLFSSKGLYNKYCRPPLVSLVNSCACLLIFRVVQKREIFLRSYSSRIVSSLILLVLLWIIKRLFEKKGNSNKESWIKKVNIKITLGVLLCHSKKNSGIPMNLFSQHL